MTAWKGRMERPVNVRVDADTRGAVSNMRNMRDAINHVGTASRDLARAMQFLQFPILAVQAVALGQAFAGVASSAYALASALAPAVGVLATLPNLLSAAGQAAGTVGLAFFGLDDALKAMGNSSNRAATEAVRGAERQETAARQIRNAEQALADAQRDATDAQWNLVEARQQARRDLEDQRAATEGMAIAEERASLRLEEARAKLVEINADASATELERRDALLDVRDAEYRLGESQRERLRHTEDLRVAEAYGVDRADGVVAANEAIRAANQRVEMANMALADAYTNTAAVGSATMVKLEEATADLSPATLAFAEKIHGLTDEFNSLRSAAGENLFPGLGVAVDNLVTMLPLAEEIIGNTARALADLAVRGSEMVSSGPWTADFREIASHNVTWLEQTGGATLNLADALRNIMVAALPLTDWLVSVVAGWADYIQRATEAGRETGALEGFFLRTREALESLWTILSNVAVGLYNIGTASSDMGGRMVTSIEDASARFREWTGSAEGQNSIRQWFEDVAGSTRVAWERTKELFDLWQTYVQPVISNVILPNLVEITLGYLAIRTAMGVINFASWASSMISALTIVAANPVFAAIGLLIGGIAFGFVAAYENSERFRDLIGRMTEVGQGFVDAWGEGGAGAALNYLGESFSNLWPEIEGTMVELGTQLQEWIVNEGPNVGTAFGDWAGRAAAWIMESLPDLLRNAGTWLGGLLMWLFQEGLPAIWTALVNFTTAFWEWVGPALPDLLRELGDLLLELIDWIIVDALPAILIAIGQWAVAFVSWVIPRIPDLLHNLFEFLRALIDWVVMDAVPAVVRAFFDLGQQMMSSLQDGLATFDLAGYLGEDMTRALNGVIDIVNSFTNGLTSLASSLGINLDITPMNHIGAPIGGGGRSRTGLPGGARSGGPQAFATGGQVPGMDPFGKDDVVARLTRGEWVMPTQSVQKYGPDFMRDVQLGKYAVGGDVQGLNPAFLDTLNRWANAVGERLMITSGFRTRAEQEAVYRRFLAGGPQAAKPGTSRHESGIAADVQGIFRRGFRGGNMAAQFGLHFPVKSENWHVESTRGGPGGVGAMVQNMFGSMVDAFIGAVSDPAKNAMHMLGGPGPIGRLAAGLGTRFVDRAVAWARDKATGLDAKAAQDAAAGLYTGPVGKGVEQWRPVVMQALSILGLPGNLTDTTLRRMMQESGGNPNAVNNWDVNARRGTPSVGLMQVIGPTYRSFRHPKHDVGPYMHGTSVNPLANILASMQYALKRYGSLPAAYNRKGGYDSGGVLRPGWTLAYNGTGENERIYTASQERAKGGTSVAIHVDARSDPRAVPIARAVAWRMKTAGV
jgi:hypothetical protein